jgi:competence protein ComGC
MKNQKQTYLIIEGLIYLVIIAIILLLINNL